MNILKKQNGFSLISLILAIALLGTVGIVGFQIGLGYINQNSLKGAVRSALIEAKQNDKTTTRTIEDNIERKLSIGTIDLAKDNIMVSKAEGGFEVSVEYIKEVNISENIKVVVDLSFTESSNK